MPDVLCLQEISRNYPSTDDGADQVKELEDFFPGYEPFFGAVHDRSGGKDKTRKQFGNLILTRISPVQVLHHLLPSPADPKVRFMSRQVAELVIPANTFDLRVMTTHLEFFSEIQAHSMTPLTHPKRLEKNYYLKNNNQVTLWADIYTEFKNAWIYSLIISILSYIILYYGIINN